MVLFSLVGLVASAGVSLVVSHEAVGQEPVAIVAPTSLVEMKEQIKLAGQEFKAEDFDTSSARIDACMKAIEALILESDRKELSEWERVHRQLRSAADALAVYGAEFPALPEWKDIQEKIKAASKAKKEGMPDEGSPSQGDAVLFSKQVAPILVEHCGRCHVDKASGEFTMGTYEQLMKGSKAGVVLFPGDPVSSPLVSVIESGQMPPSGNRVPVEKVALIRKWVEQGAKYDIENSKLPLKTVAAGVVETAPAPKPMDVKASTGKETVSFSSDIAPLLVANCNGCHYEANNVRGGLRLNTFKDLLQGGDSGPIIEPGQSDDSLLVKKLLGTEGQRMPAGGRPPLSEAQITLVKTWIAEGATFDGDNQDSRLDAVIARSFTAKANHDELMQRIRQRVQPGDLWVLAGSLPPGLPASFYAEVIDLVQGCGARAFLDTSGEPLRLGCAARPALVKPNVAEAQEITGQRIDSPHDALIAAGYFLSKGIEMVALSMGAKGLALATADEAVWAKPPIVQVSNPTGAGDNLLAGVVCALQQGLPLRDVARWGVAAGTASAMRDGVSVGNCAEVEAIYRQTLISVLR